MMLMHYTCDGTAGMMIRLVARKPSSPPDNANMRIPKADCMDVSNWRYVAIVVVLWCPALPSSSASVTVLR